MSRRRPESVAVDFPAAVRVAWCALALLGGLSVLRPAVANDAPAAHGHEPEHAAPAVAEKQISPSPATPAAAPARPISMEQLRTRLDAAVGAVRESQTRARPSRAHARVAAPRVVPLPPPAESVHAAAAPPAEPAHQRHWSYAGDTGPAHWAELEPRFASCATGQRQSPIDIRDGFRVDLPAIRFDYRPTGFNVIDNGHTVQANLGYGNSIEVSGRRYELLQFHFHRPSEERIEGRAFDMVIHLVHKDPEGRLAVVAVLLEQGSAHPAVQAVWNSLPLEKGIEQGSPVSLDPSQLLPADRRYYTYMGSLTTPPCTEGVLWLVLKQPVAVSPDQLALFARLYPMNARPIQYGRNRMIKESN